MIGLSEVYALTRVFMLFWGVMGGVLVTSQRTLLQEHTPDEMMGRVMSLLALSMGGTLPLAALIILVLRRLATRAARSPRPRPRARQAR